MIKVTVWHENYHDRTDEATMAMYPGGMHNVIASFLSKDEEFEVRTATLDQPECGLPDELLEDTDVLLWWGHAKHDDVPDELAKKVHERVLRGMGIIFLHSAHMSKPFRLTMGTSCTLKWRDNDRERLWTVLPQHPIAKGVDEYIELESEEMYGERFDIPQPDELVFLGWFAGGEVFRSGCTWYKGLGKVFYFQPGHETNPSYHNEQVQKIITNAVRWAAPQVVVDKLECPHYASLEKKRLENN